MSRTSVYLVFQDTSDFDYAQTLKGVFVSYGGAAAFVRRQRESGEKQVKSKHRGQYKFVRSGGSSREFMIECWPVLEK